MMSMMLEMLVMFYDVDFVNDVDDANYVDDEGDGGCDFHPLFSSYHIHSRRMRNFTSHVV
jgi:hypothetical protein